MTYVIEFRNGTFLGHRQEAPATSLDRARRYASRKKAEATANLWGVAGAMVVTFDAARAKLQSGVKF